MPITLRVAAATAVLSALVLGVFPGIDREVAGWFFDPAMQRFPIAATETGKALRLLGMYLPHLTWLAAIAAIVVALLHPGRPMPMRPSIAIFLIVTALAIPALVVNAGFKQNWARPRPVHVAEFAGRHPFKAWWDNSGACARNCSFMSGETSAAAMLVGAAMLAPLNLRPFAIGGAALFTLMVGLLRVAFGGHWLSDVLLGGSVSVLLMLVAHRIILGSRGIEDEEVRLALSQTGLLLREWTSRRLRGAGRAAAHSIGLAGRLAAPAFAALDRRAAELRAVLFAPRGRAVAPAE